MTFYDLKRKMYSCNPLFKKSKKVYPVNDIVENESFDNKHNNNKTKTNSSENTSQALKKQKTIYK